MTNSAAYYLNTRSPNMPLIFPSDEIMHHLQHPHIPAQTKIKTRTLSKQNKPRTGFPHPNMVLKQLKLIHTIDEIRGGFLNILQYQLIAAFQFVNSIVLGCYFRVKPHSQIRTHLTCSMKCLNENPVSQMPSLLQLRYRLFLLVCFSR